jgi:hypothetical protein
MAVVTTQLIQDYGIDCVINNTNDHCQNISCRLQKATRNLVSHCITSHMATQKECGYACVRYVTVDHSLIRLRIEVRVLFCLSWLPPTQTSNIGLLNATALLF